MLPTISWGGDTFYDMSSIISPDRYQRYATYGVALHHSVGAAHFPDLNLSGSNMDEEIAHIRQIEAQHLAQGYGGFGYQAIAFASGRVYVAGDCMGARAHVAGRNGEIEGICMAGDYRVLRPAQPLIAGVARYYRARVNMLGVLTIKGHREWATSGNETSCPGDAGLAAVIGAIYMTAVAQEDDMTLAELEARIAALEQWRDELAPKIDADWAWREEHKNAHSPQPVPSGGPLPPSPVSDIILNDFDSDPNT